MSEIINSQVVAWTTNRARPMANTIYGLVYQINMYLADYTTQGIAALINAAGVGLNVADGADTSGIPEASGTDIENLAAALVQLQTCLEVTQVVGLGGLTVQTIVSSISTLTSP